MLIIATWKCIALMFGALSLGVGLGWALRGYRFATRERVGPTVDYGYMGKSVMADPCSGAVFYQNSSNTAGGVRGCRLRAGHAGACQ